MPLTQGRRFGPDVRLGPYEILDLIGTGGMGQVYRARDTRLDRTVAIKVLTTPAGDGHKARVRFEREARAISSLSHPHICAVYDVGHEDDVDYIVMEYLQGESLARRLDRRALRLDQALPYAVQIASALAEAHRAGIVHRDLKPGNVMLTPTGAKLLDFGLAKLKADPIIGGGTTPDTVTVEGQLVGTLPYMAPEQVEGKEADARSDIFAFGAMLHEMITQRRVFEGGQAHLIAAILSSEPPPPSSVQPLCPPELDHAVARCLAKDPSERWQSAQDLLMELKWAVARVPVTESPRRRSLRVLGWAAGAAAATALIVGWMARRDQEDRFPTASPHQVTMSSGWESSPALSPDGGLIAYASDESGNPDVWIVDARGGNVIRLTDDPASDTDPAWLPDGSALVFTSNRGGRTGLWKVLRFGGAASLVLPDAEDAAISPDGTQIAFARPGPTGEHRVWIARMSEPGQARMLTHDGDGLWEHRHPAFSPDGRSVCYDAFRDLWVVPVEGSGARRLTTDDEHDVEPAWSPDGRYVYFSSLRGGALALWRVSSGGGPPQRLTFGTGPERHPSFSRDGKRLAYSTLSGDADLVLHDLPTHAETVLSGLGALSPAWTPDQRQIVFVSARIGGRFDLWIQSVDKMRAVGPPRRLTDQAGSVAHPAVSPDGAWVAYYRVAAGQRDIWTVPLAGGPPIQFTDDPAADILPAWSPDGKQIAFASERGGGSHIWVAPVDNGRSNGAARQMTFSSTVDRAPAWSPDGKWIAYIGVSADGANDVHIIGSTGGEPRALPTDGSADRVVWDPGARALYVSGSWDPWISLRKFDVASGRRILLDPPLRFSQNAAHLEFDISRDGRVVAFGRDETRGDIWAIDSLDRHY